MGLMTRLTVMVLALTTVACGPGPRTPSPPTATTPPEFVQRIVGADGTARRLLVYEASQVIDSVRAPVPLTDQRGSIWWDPVASDPNSLVIGWLGGVCGVDPALRVDRQESGLSLEVFDGHVPPSDTVCPAKATIYGLELTFREPISRLEVSVALSEEPQQ